jgi:hypothetical protein
MRRSLLLTLSLLLACSSNDATPDPIAPGADMAGVDMTVADMDSPDQGAPLTLRVATYNTSLFGASQGALTTLLSDATSEHPRKVAATLQTIRPDIILINEFDYDEAGESARLLRENFLSVSQDGRAALDYPHVYVSPSNTGEPSGHDLSRDGQIVTTPGSQAYGDDSFGFGQFPGQYAFIVLSRYPIDTAAIRTFRLMRWQALPDHKQPIDHYGAEAAAAMRLSSKNHADIPVRVSATRTLHILASHPTPPSFDGPEDRNGRRNHDEIALWTSYLSPDSPLVDDAGVAGGLAADASFVILGDMNSDPIDGDSIHEGITGLLTHARVQDPTPTGAGGPVAAERDGQANTVHKGDAARDTADFSDRSVGNLRVDYVLPSRDLTVKGAGVFWPLPNTPDAALTSVSDHHPVWVDLEL